MEHAIVVAQPLVSNVTLNQKQDSVQGSAFTFQTRQLAKSAQASGSGRAAAGVQAMGSL